ncbi:DUF1349 domain-containing protein [Streptomyces sp. AP-93]|uniref:DUF1349 domain-containing protein n=1 Tax=Streptomyces sp. AP-93 TaxID=2929048 RepID=UPI001FAF3D49|nr:DUF1349 domain-containing protein [Streptomyces sp. AP-93]MCJ0869962.1 DUF1349 domain-containing protein [Streptomyces sp. AP-93]
MLTHNELLRQECTRFLRPARLIALVTAALMVLALGLLYAFGNHASCAGTCPADPTGPDGTAVSDQFAFMHRDLGREGSITVRMTSMTGTITYPPPHHDQIVPGLVPWAKAGIIVKDGVGRGSSYAALMVTGEHGVRMQYDYGHDIAGSSVNGAAVSAGSPRWLRLTRAGDTVTGYESSDGERWVKVAAVKLAGLSETAQVGMFATSPGDLTLRPVGLGGSTEQVRFTQAAGSFDHIGLEGAAAGGSWRAETIGEMNNTDWEKRHKASGAVEEGGTITVTGVGDIGPAATTGGRPVEGMLTGLSLALLIVLVVAVRFAGGGSGSRRPLDGAPLTRAVLGARAVVVGAVTFVTGLLAVGIVVPVGVAVLKSNGVPVVGLSPLTGARVVVGVAAALALTAVLALALGALFKRRWPAVLVAVSAVVVPYAVSTVPLLSDGLAQWLLRVTPAAGFAVQQTLVEYPQVTAHYAPSAGYFPLPWWAGVAVLCAYAVAAMALALRRLPRSGERAGAPAAVPVGERA